MADLYLDVRGRSCMEIPIKEIDARRINVPPSPVLQYCGMIVVDPDCERTFVLNESSESFFKFKFALASLWPTGTEHIHKQLQATGEKETRMWTKQELKAVRNWYISRLKIIPTFPIPDDDFLGETKGILQRAALEEIERRKSGERPPEYDGSPVWCVPNGRPDYMPCDAHVHEQPVAAAFRKLRQEAMKDGFEDRVSMMASPIEQEFTFVTTTPDGGKSLSKFFVLRLKDAKDMKGFAPKGWQFRQGEWVSPESIATGLMPMGKYGAFLRFATAEEWRSALGEIRSRGVRDTAAEEQIPVGDLASKNPVDDPDLPGELQRLSTSVDASIPPTPGDMPTLPGTV